MGDLIQNKIQNKDSPDVQVYKFIENIRTSNYSKDLTLVKRLAIMHTVKDDIRKDIYFIKDITNMTKRRSIYDRFYINVYQFILYVGLDNFNKGEGICIKSRVLQNTRDTSSVYSKKQKTR